MPTIKTPDGQNRSFPTTLAAVADKSAMAGWAYAEYVDAMKECPKAAPCYLGVYNGQVSTYDLPISVLEAKNDLLKCRAQCVAEKKTAGTSTAGKITSTSDYVPEVVSETLGAGLGAVPWWLWLIGIGGLGYVLYSGRKRRT